MYLSIGNDFAVRESAVIGIFDMDNTTTSPRTRLFLEKAQKGQPYDYNEKYYTASSWFARIAIGVVIGCVVGAIVVGVQ